MKKRIPSVKELRQAGYKVFVKHDPFDMRYSAHDYTQITQGMIEVTIIPPNSKFEYTAASYRSLKDQPNRKLGLRIAVGRTYKHMLKHQKELEVENENATS
jgi:hypothetical protein